MKIDIIGFTETQIKLSFSTSKILEKLKFFNINFNGNENKFIILANGCRNYVALLNQFFTNGLSILRFKIIFKFCRQIILFNVSL